jgi:hypothetical protein
MTTAYYLDVPGSNPGEGKVTPLTFEVFRSLYIVYIGRPCCREPLVIADGICSRSQEYKKTPVRPIPTVIQK